MSFRKKNLEAIKRNDTRLYAKIEGVRPSGRYKAVPVPGKPQMVNLLDTKDNQLFYDPKDPMADMQKNIKSRNIKVPNLNIFLGTGLFLHVFTFYQLYKYEGHTNIFIEKDLDLFVSVLDFVDFSDLFNNPRFYFLVDEDYTAVLTGITNVMHATNSKLYAKAINFIEDYKSYINNKEYYLSCVKAAKEAIAETIIFYGNDPLDSLIGINHTFINIREIIDHPGVMDLEGVFKGKPGIVVATGPSLMKNIDQLHGIEDKAVICSVDASMRVLRKNNLKPHIVTCLERVIETSRLFEDLTPEDTEDVFLAGTPVIHPNSYKNWPGERFVVYRNFATFKWLDIPKGMLEIGPSAGNMAFKMLEYLGCDPIILIGQDLAYGDDGITHAEGTTYGTKQTGKAFLSNVEVEGNYQPKVLTTKTWNSFLNFYHKDVSASKAKVINATEGGAKILGAELMTLKEAIDQHINEPLNVVQTIRDHLKYPTAEEIEQMNMKTLSTVMEGLEYCRYTIDRFKEAIGYCVQFEEEVFKPFTQTKKYDEEKGRELMAKIGKTSEIVNEELFYKIVMHYVQSYIIKTGIEINGVKARANNLPEEQVNIAALSKNFYHVLVGLLEKMVTLMEDLKKSFEDAD